MPNGEFESFLSVVRSGKWRISVIALVLVALSGIA